MKVVLKLKLHYRVKLYNATVTHINKYKTMQGLLAEY